MNTIMKTLQFFCLIIVSALFGQLKAQNVSDALSQDYSGFRASVRGGYDFPASYKFDQTTPFVDYKGGLEAGLSLDYYWSWFGIGADFDYIQNKVKNTFPTANLLDPYEHPINQFSLTENKITRMFYGIGPDFKFLATPKSDLEFKLRAGLSSVKGGETELTGKSDDPQSYGSILLNDHEGFDGEKSVFAGKASLQYNYFFSKNVGFHIGGYYIYHHNASDLKNETKGFSNGFVLTNDATGVAIVHPDNFVKRTDPIEGNVQSFGVFAGLTFRFNKKEKIEVPEIPKPQECTITVTAKDKYTKEIIPDTQIALLDESGNTVKAGTTDASGIVVFDNIQKGNYTVTGTYQDKNLEGTSVAMAEFGDCVKNGGIRKEVLLNNENFIVMGKVVNCKNNEPIANASVIVKNNKTGVSETYASDGKGEFSFTASPNTTYTIYGKKANYMSQTMNISTSDYNRSKSQYIQLQICMDKADCNDAVVLKNILYDLDKSFIREDAKPELNRLVQFMNDNPEMRVELSSHTDSRGSDAYNLKLSQRRAQAAVDYIISQGISKNRLIAKGYGETRLVNNCGNGVKCTEDEHQLNRRTEMKVLCPNK